MLKSLRLYLQAADDMRPHLPLDQPLDQTHTAPAAHAVALRPAPVTIYVNGAAVAAYPGETIATALLAAGTGRFRTARDGAPRAPVCNMGVCFECAVTVDGRPGTRSCMTLVAPHMHIEIT